MSDDPDISADTAISLAREIGKEIAAYLKTKYVSADARSPSAFTMAVRNFIYSEIDNAIRSGGSENAITRSKRIQTKLRRLLNMADSENEDET